MTPAVAPVYILASERSGTNLLRVRLTDNQTTYFGPSPAHFLKFLYYREAFYGNLKEDTAFLELISDALALCYNHWAPWDVEYVPEELMAGYDAAFSDRNAILLSHYIYLRYAQDKGFQSYINKDNHLFRFAHQLREQIGNVKFIYLHRDPRDFALSQIKRPESDASIVTHAMNWKAEQLDCIRTWKDFSEDEIIRVSYEQLVSNEDGTLERIFSFLGVSKSETATEQPQETGISDWKNLKKPTIKSNFNKYKKELSGKQINFIESIDWEVMRLLGYSTENEKRPRTSTSSRIINQLHGRFVKAMKLRKFRKSPEFQLRKSNWEVINRLNI